MIPAISAEKEEFLEQEIACGAYANRVEAVNAGLDLLRKQRQLLARLEASRRQLDSGEYTEFDGPGLRAFFDELRSRSQAPSGADVE
jgi:Arc/MetJ-type ribon-helix-helix transcriptional regulator